MKKNIFAVLLVAIFCLILLYIAMALNTNSLIKYVESVYRGEIPEEEIADTWFSTYNITQTRPETTDVDIDITPIFTIHNFKHGYLWVRIDCHATDSNGDCTYGEICIERWEIHKTDGKWEIVNCKLYGKLF